MKMPAVMAATTVKTALTARRMKIAGDLSFLVTQCVRSVHETASKLAFRQNQLVL